METTLVAPIVAYSVCDAINRMALATGCVRNAMIGSNSDYNGHRVMVEFNSYRKYWVAEYFWAGRNVLARGTMEECIAAAQKYYQKGHKGASVVCKFRNAEEALKGKELFPELLTEAEATARFNAEHSDWRYAYVNDAVHRQTGGLLIAANNADEYHAACRKANLPMRF